MEFQPNSVASPKKTNKFQIKNGYFCKPSLRPSVANHMSWQDLLHFPLLLSEMFTASFLLSNNGVSFRGISFFTMLTSTSSWANFNGHLHVKSKAGQDIQLVNCQNPCCFNGSHRALLDVCCNAIRNLRRGAGTGNMNLLAIGYPIYQNSSQSL